MICWCEELEYECLNCKLHKMWMSLDLEEKEDLKRYKKITEKKWPLTDKELKKLEILFAWVSDNDLLKECVPIEKDERCVETEQEFDLIINNSEIEGIP